MSTDLLRPAAATPPQGAPPRVLLVSAPYVREVVEGMRAGALRLLAGAGAVVDELEVAGALELPQAIRLALGGPVRHDAYVALGCVIRGETDHYEHVCREAMAGLMRVSLDHALCVGNGLLTVATLAQARARSGPNGHNKGAEAAAAALSLLDAARSRGGMEGGGA